MAESRVIGIVGSRSRDTDDDFDICREVFDRIYEPGDTIVSGGCPRGGDRFAEVIAQESNIPIKIHPAEWSKYGPTAGLVRNNLIARDCDILIAVVAETRTGGTEDTIRKAENLGKEVRLV